MQVGSTVNLLSTGHEHSFLFCYLYIFQNVLLSRLDTLRRNKEFCDVVLYAGQKEISCHKVVLAAMSPCFYELFTAAQDNLSWANSNTNGAALVTGSGQLATQNIPGVNQVCFSYKLRK